MWDTVNSRGICYVVIVGYSLPCRLDAAGEPVVGGVGANLSFEGAGGGGRVDDEQLRAGHAGEVLERLHADGGGHHGVVRRPGGEPGGRCGGEVGLGLPDGAADGEPGQGGGRGDDLDGVRHEAEPVAHVGQGDDDGGAGVGGEDEPDGVVAAADGQRVDLQAGAGGGEGRS